MSQDAFTPPGECPVCGQDVPGGARSCPSCGADGRTGWNEDATRYDALDLPDEAFDGESDRPPRKRWHQSALWLGVAIVLIVLFVVALVAR